MANAMRWFTNMFRNSRSCSIMGSYGSYYVFTRSLAPMAPRTKVSISTQIRPHLSLPIKIIFRLFLYVGVFLFLISLGACLAFITMGSLEQKWDFHVCSWFVAAVVTIWPLLSSAQLILHAKLYRDEYGDLRTLLDY